MPQRPLLFTSCRKRKDRTNDGCGGNACIDYSESSLHMVTVIVSAVVGTLVFVGLFTWMGLRAAHSAERAAHDTKYRRRMLLIGAAVYLFIAFRTLMSVLVGNQSI